MSIFSGKQGQASSIIVLGVFLLVLGGIGAVTLVRRPPAPAQPSPTAAPERQGRTREPGVVTNDNTTRSSQQQGKIVGFTTPVPTQTPFPTSIPPTATNTPPPAPQGQNQNPGGQPGTNPQPAPNPLPTLPDYAQCDADSQEEHIETGCNGNLNGTHFKETFTATVTAPRSVMNGYPRWFAQPAMQGIFGWDFAPEPMMAQHSANCGPPPATHAISTYQDTVFLCKDHIMTAINPPSGGTSSGIVTLKPNHLVDLSQGEATIRVDVSTSSPSAGDWWEIWFTPWEDQLVSPTDHWYHHAGPPTNAVQMEIADFPVDDSKRWATQVYHNARPTRPEAMDESNAMAFYKGPNFRDRVPVSDTRRDLYEIRMTQNYIKLYIKSPKTNNQLSLVDEFAIPGGFGSNAAVVQFQQSNYEPEKNRKIGCGGDCPAVTTAATWHWDNVEIYPAIPYTLISTNEFQIVNGRTPNTVTFKEPAPPGALLIFNGQSVGNTFTVTFNNGSTAQAKPTRPPNGVPGGGLSHDIDFLTYTVPVPVGATSAALQGTDACQPSNCGPVIGEYGVWMAQNFHVIAR